MPQSLQNILVSIQKKGLLPALRDIQKKQDPHITDEALDTQMLSLLPVMRESVKTGMQKDLHSMSHMTGGQASKLLQSVEEGKTASGLFLGKAAARALAVAECNAAMGRIVAAPTAGACGILPATLFSLEEAYHLTEKDLLEGLYMSAAVGLVIAQRASISGAEGGCQAECGTASAMAASAAVILRKGTPEQAMDAAAFALMNVLGLVCDPVKGLVEVPCVFRNVMGVANALTCADLALSNIRCPLVPDEVIDQMKAVGDLMPHSLKETAEGGCAACPSGAKCMEVKKK